VQSIFKTSGTNFYSEVNEKNRRESCDSSLANGVFMGM